MPDPHLRKGPSRAFASSRPLKTAQQSQTGITEAGRKPGCVRLGAFPFGGRSRASDHRQDSKGTRWMPWHQESKKGVDGCDKPRVGAEQPLIRGFPNGATQRW